MAKKQDYSMYSEKYGPLFSKEEHKKLEELSFEERAELDEELARSWKDYKEGRWELITDAVSNARFSRQRREQEQLRQQKLAKAKDFIGRLVAAGISEHIANRFAESGHMPDEYGVWAVYGEDPNCDFGGAHHQPELGNFEGTFEEVCIHAHGLSGFYQWGAGGEIKKSGVKKITKLSGRK